MRLSWRFVSGSRVREWWWEGRQQHELGRPECDGFGRECYEFWGAAAAGADEYIEVWWAGL